MASRTEITEEELKNHIKGIITSNPIVSTIQSIMKDYKEMIGTTIPYQKFKYNSVEHFLKSIPDTCVVRGTGSFAQVTLVPSKKSIHINEMVVRQKVNTRGSRKFSAPRRRSVQANSVPPSRRPSTWQHSQYNYSMSPNSSSSSSSSFGYPSTEPFKTINNNVSCTNARGNDTSAQRLLKTSTDVKSINIGNNPVPCGNVPNKNTNMQGISTGIRNIDVQGISKGALNINDPSDVTVRSYVSHGLRGENTEERRSLVMEPKGLRSRIVQENLQRLIQEQVKHGNVIPSTSTPKKDTELSESPQKVPDNTWNNMTPIETRHEDDFEDYSDNVEKEFNRSKIKLNNLLNNFRVYEEEEEDTSNVPKRVQLNLKTLISQFINGIWCSDLPSHYRRLFKKDLNYMEYGYTSLIEMCITLKNIFHYVRPGKDDFKLYDRSKPLPDNVEKLYTIASYSVGKKVNTSSALPDLEWEDFRGHIPEDIVKLGENVTREFLPVGTKVESIFDVVVTEVYDPSKFWFYLGRNDCPSDLDRLMDCMQTFYSNPDNAKEYSVPPGAVKEGLYCVQVIYGEYHRARVIRVLIPDEPEQVRVMFIDYGTVCKVAIKGMCFLRKEFAELNAQAIRGRLTNILPTLKGHPWLRRTSDRFRTLVNRRDTKIKVSYIDWNEEFVCVFLADVTDKDNVLYLNQVLVEEQLAVWDGEPQVERLVLSNFKCKVKSIHLFPTFVELEYGLAPTASEMYAMANMKVPLQFCIPQYFEPDEEILQIKYDESMEEMENAFIESIKNHKRGSALDLSSVDVGAIMRGSSIDNDVFGEMKEDIMEFYEMHNLREKREGEAQAARNTSADHRLEEELFCDIEEDESDETVRVEVERSKAVERQLEDCEPIRVLRKNIELSGSIIEKLERYSSLDSVESVAGTSQAVSSSGQSEHLDLQEELLQQEDAAADQLSTIFEQSEIEIDPSEEVASPTISFSEVVCLNRRQSRPDINIFDDPEEFEEDISDNSEENENARLIPTKSFLKTVEKRPTEFPEEEIEHVEESICTTENSTGIYSDSESTPHQFDINSELRDPELREAFLSFLKTRRTNSRAASCSSSACLCGEQGCPEHTGTGEESFLKCKAQGESEREEDAACGKSERYDGSVKEEGSVWETESEIDVVPFDSNLEETRKTFVSTLSLNNPFRPYLEAGKSTDHLSEVATDYFTLADSPSTNSSLTTNLKPPTDAQTLIRTAVSNSDSEGSDYKVFVPRGNPQDVTAGSSKPLFQKFVGKFQRPETPPRLRNQKFSNSVDSTMTWVQNCMETRGMNTPPRAETPPRLRNLNGPDGVMNQEWSGSWAQSPMAPRGMMTPPGVAAPPRMFTTPGFVPPYYPPWSNSTGCPVSQYPQWSNGGNQPMPGPHYPHPRDSLRPPPGFAYQGPPPPNFKAFNMGPGRMMPPMPMYQQGGPVYYAPPPPLHPPPPNSMTMTENDFYDRYNKNLLRRSNLPS